MNDPQMHRLPTSQNRHRTHIAPHLPTPAPQQPRAAVMSVPPQVTAPAGQAPVPYSQQHPRLSVTVQPQACPDEIQLEYQALPGSLLGGPFTLRPMSRSGMRLVTPDRLPDLHLAYLRDAYVHNPEMTLLIDQMGGQLLRGRNRMGLLTHHAAVGENLCRAVLGVMNRQAAALAAKDAQENARDRSPAGPPPGVPVALTS